WFVDLPQTVRLKATVIKLLPLGPEYVNDTINSLCVASYRGNDNFSCYFTLHSKEAEEEISKKNKCQAFIKRLASGDDKDWIKTSDKTYLYAGSDAETLDK